MVVSMKSFTGLLYSARINSRISRRNGNFLGVFERRTLDRGHCREIYERGKFANLNKLAGSEYFFPIDRKEGELVMWLPENPSLGLQCYRFLFYRVIRYPADTHLGPWTVCSESSENFNNVMKLPRNVVIIVCIVQPDNKADQSLEFAWSKRFPERIDKFIFSMNVGIVGLT